MAVITAEPTYRAMFEMPDAAPTWAASTELVATDEHGLLERQVPTATSTIGSTNAPYLQDDWVPIRITKPAVMTMNPMPITMRVPKRAASFGTAGVSATMPTVAGRVAR